MSERTKAVPFEVELQQQAAEWNNFFGEERISERAIQDAQEVVGRLKDNGWKNLKVITAPNRVFSRNAPYPEWKIKPNQWFYDRVREGKISGEPTRIGGSIAIFDTTPKPDYTDGTQMYDDPESYQTLLADLRRQGAIDVRNWIKHVPETSRFGISADEYEEKVFPALAKQTDIKGLVDEGRLTFRLPKLIEFNVYGQQHAPYIGDTTGWEWLHDRFDGDGRLVGGYADDGGLGDVNYDWSDGRSDDIAGRVLGEIPSQA